MIDLGKVKLHVRVDADDDDVYLNLLIGVATEYVTDITNIPNDANAPFRYDLACLLLIANWYANRESVVEGTLNKVPHGFDMLIFGLKKGNQHV